MKHHTEQHMIMKRWVWLFHNFPQSFIIMHRSEQIKSVSSNDPIFNELNITMHYNTCSGANTIIILHKWNINFSRKAIFYTYKNQLGALQRSTTHLGPLRDTPRSTRPHLKTPRTPMDQPPKAPRLFLKISFREVCRLVLQGCYLKYVSERSATKPFEAVFQNRIWGAVNPFAV